MTKDYKVEVKVKNNLLYKAMIENGIETAADLARFSKMRTTTIGRALNLKESLYGRNDKIKPIYLKLSEVLKRLPEDLVPRAHWHDPLKKNKASFEADFKDLSYLMPPKNPDELLIESDKRKGVDAALNKLSEKERYVIKERFGFTGQKTLNELGKELGTSGTRIRQIEEKALNKLKWKGKLNKCLNTF